MKVHELIEQLQQHNQEAEVVAWLTNPKTGCLEHWDINGLDDVFDPERERTARISISERKKGQ